MALKRVKAVPLTPENYRAYGDVISVRPDIVPRDANMGTAKRYNWVGKLENLRPKAQPNLCVFHCNPQVSAPQTSFEAKILEKHPESTQAFIPMSGADRFMVLVSLGGDAPDLSTFGAFIASKAQGITYKPGVWHHPLVAMDTVTDFACLVWEDGSSGDCEIVKLDQSLTIEF